MNVALLSDIHFGKFSRTKEFSVPSESIDDETRGAPSLQNGLIEILKDKKVEYIFIAGDLTSIGSPQEFYFCEKKILEISDAVGVPKENVIVGLGNHDVDWNVSSLCKKYESNQNDVIELIREKYQIAAANMAVTNLERLTVPDIYGPVPYSGVVEKDKFVIFVLNTGWLCSHDQEYPHGKLSKNQINWFDDKTMKYKDDQRTKIVLMHHHPILYSYPNPTPDISMIEEGCELIDIAGKRGINLILHGHRHHPTVKTQMESDWKNPITFICAGSLSVNSKHRGYGEIPNTVHIINFDNAPQEFILYNYEYSCAEGWHPLDKDSPNTPLDKEMWLGKIFSDEDVKSEILKFTQGHDMVRLEWSDLPPELKHMRCKKLNDVFKEIIPNNYIISGHFPDEVYIIPNGGI